MEAKTQEPLEIVEINLPELVRKLHQSRQDRAHYRALCDEAEATFRKEHQHLYDAEAAFREECASLDNMVRAAAVAFFKTNPTNSKKEIVPGVGIRVTTNYKYDSQAALNWAQEHKMCLTLDSGAFKTICKSESTRPDFVEVEETLGATIATDLERAVAELNVQEI